MQASISTARLSMEFPPASRRQLDKLDTSPRRSLYILDTDDNISHGRRSGFNEENKDKQHHNNNSSILPHPTISKMLNIVSSRTPKPPCPALSMEIPYHSPCSPSRSKTVVAHGSGIIPAKACPSLHATTDRFRGEPPATSETAYGTFSTGKHEEENSIVVDSIKDIDASIVKMHQAATDSSVEPKWPNGNTTKDLEDETFPLVCNAVESRDGESGGDEEAVPPPTKFTWQCSEITMSDFGEDVELTKGFWYGDISPGKPGGRNATPQQMVRRWNPIAIKEADIDYNTCPPQRKDSRDSWNDIYDVHRSTPAQDEQRSSVMYHSSANVTFPSQPFLKSRKCCSASPATKATDSICSVSSTDSPNQQVGSHDIFVSRTTGDAPIQIPERCLSPLPSTHAVEYNPSETSLEGYEGDCDDEAHGARTTTMCPPKAGGHVWDRWNSSGSLSPTSCLKPAAMGDGGLLPWKHLLGHAQKEDERQSPLRVPRRKLSVEPGTFEDGTVTTSASFVASSLNSAFRKPLPGCIPAPPFS